MSLPENYIEWITRVSELVSYKYPFAWTEAERRYKQWLDKVWVEESDYHNEACDVWTFVHLQMEKEVLKQPLDLEDEYYTKHSKEVECGLQFMKDYELTNMETEIYCRDNQNRYQWSIDLVAEKDWKRILVDWKTWGIAKKRFWLPHNARKPYDKLKKVALQLSLYAKALWNIDEIYVVWLHEQGYFAYKLELSPDAELEKLLLEFDKEAQPLKFNMIDDMEIEILKPTEQFGNIKVRVDLSKLDDGKTKEETLDEAVKTAKDLATKMS